MATTVFSIVVKEIEERRESIAQALISGSAKDYSELTVQAPRYFPKPTQKRPVRCLIL